MRNRPSFTSPPQIFVRRRDHPHIRFNRAVAADALELLLLQDAQKRDLNLRTQLRNFVEKNRAAVRSFEAADALLQCTGECALLMTEQFAGNQLSRQRRAIDSYERRDRSVESPR